MQLFTKTLCFMLVLGAVSGADAATSRASARNTNALPPLVPESRAAVSGAASRMPTLTGKTTTTSTTTSSSLLANADCINAYSECIKGADICGENFEECTTKVLFHAQMPNCLSTLGQCSSDGVNSLFGTTNVASLSNVAAKNSYGEITDYTYPTDGSVLGQMIAAAAISNRYDTSACIRRYTSCLKKDTVCGSDFELCTTDKEFKKQRVFCDSTLARCNGEGVTELLGSSTLTATPTKSSRVGEMIAEGAALAAVNTVSTCYKVVDQCILNACSENPYKCYENTNQSVVELVEAINNGTLVTTELVESIVNKSSISAYIKSQCLDTIGSSKYCYATFVGNGQMPTASQLRDEDNQEEVYEAAYDARMNAAMKVKITELVNNFDTRAKQKCTDTIKSCAMRVCGGGIGAACYAAVFGGADKSINGSATYNEIKTGCASIVNTDTNCKYAAVNPNSTGAYSYTYINRDAFDILFPEYVDGSEVDPVGIVAALNSSLATNYSDAALAQMKKQCQSVATSCVRSMCGSDFVNCYRNRTDIYSDLTNTNDETFNKSMNKVGGVLDYTVVLGLCLDTVKNASVCEEHLAIEANKIKLDSSKYSDSWGGETSVRNGWITSGDATGVEATTKQVQDTDENGNLLCTSKTGEVGVCYTMDSSRNMYDTPVMISYTTYVQSQAASSLFKDLIYDIEKEAQATYNAKLTREQNMCMASNNGGVIGNKEIGSTFMWAKLKTNKVPTGYSVNGLSTNQFVASNDLYGSFCRVRVTLQSDDKNIQEKMKDKSWATAYFVAGDSFTCGSWIPEKDLVAISEDVAKEKLGKDGSGDLSTGQKWGVAGATVLSAIAGGVGTDLLQSRTDLGGLLRTTSNSNEVTKIKRQLNLCRAKARNVFAGDTEENIAMNIRDAMSAVSEIKDNFDDLQIEYNAASMYDTTAEVTGHKNEAVLVAENLTKECEKLANKDASELKQEQDKNFWNNGGGRAMVDLTGAALVGATGGITTAQIMRESNRNQFTAEQQEWMNNVGRHITCYIGGDEAGSYGDIITTSLE